MPLVMFFLLFILAMTSVITASPHTSVQSDYNNQASVIATQMAWYHNEATTLCTAPNVCAVGKVTVPNADMPPGASMVWSSNFESLFNGTEVITIFLPTSPFSVKTGLNGLVAAAVYTQAGLTPYAGSWNAATQTVNGRTSTDAVTAAASGSVVIPQGTEGVTFQDGEAMMVTPTS
jgi:hypothetical protein